MEPIYKCLVPAEELVSRMARFRSEMDRKNPDWHHAFLFGRVNIYYLTGTMPDGLLYIPRDGEATLWARRTFARARAESVFPDIRPMDSFRDAAAAYAAFSGTVHIETELLPLAFYERFNKHFKFDTCASVDGVMSTIRSVKSPFEVEIVRRCGKLHEYILDAAAPKLFVEGMSETELVGELTGALLRAGGQGLARFAMFQGDVTMGHVCFGESSLADTTFNGPNGNLGLSAAVPLNGSRERLLKKGDHIMLDIGAGVEGYNTDKTQNYTFKAEPLPETRRVRDICLEVQRRAAEMLVPGMSPSHIYKSIYESLDPGFAVGFMGYGAGKVKFLGHGVGLQVDEYPVIARGFDLPLEENMVIALEPKYGIAGVGMVGIENTFLVTKNGGECLTGLFDGLLSVY